jgi:hypothetical protein
MDVPRNLIIPVKNILINFLLRPPKWGSVVCERAGYQKKLPVDFLTNDVDEKRTRKVNDHDSEDDDCHDRGTLRRARKFWREPLPGQKPR